MEISACGMKNHRKICANKCLRASTLLYIRLKRHGTHQNGNHGRNKEWRVALTRTLLLVSKLFTVEFGMIYVENVGILTKLIRIWVERWTVRMEGARADVRTLEGAPIARRWKPWERHFGIWTLETGRRPPPSRKELSSLPLALDDYGNCWHTKRKKLLKRWHIAAQHLIRADSCRDEKCW